MTDYPPVEPFEPLAIVGIGCRFPGGINDPDTYWKFLCDERSAITEVPANRWNVDRFHSYEPGAAGKLITRWGGFVDQLEDFAAEFFSITPREAARMDPQQRWLLEMTWEAMEDALCPPSSMRGGNTGVFVGLSASDYNTIQQQFIERIDGYSNSGSAMSIAANRISYQFDLRGPSMAVDTACSSGLVAVDLACRHIWSGNCDCALAGAVSALIVPNASLGFSKASMLSPTGQCHVFDARADGYVRSEGGGMIFIKPLRRALAEGNPVHAVIRSCAVNQDGRTSSMSVPSRSAQRAMIEEALATARVLPDEIGYVETHGTGTPVGDPIETSALGEALCRQRKSPLLIGSVKSNLGHLETAAGMAGIIKAALIVRHGRIPPTINFAFPNSNIRFDEWKLRVVTELTDLPRSADGRALVAVNSFGFGGTNAHVLVESAPSAKSEPGERHQGPLVLPVSAKCPEALGAMAAGYRDLLAARPADAPGICLSAALGRDHLGNRLVVIGRDGAALADELSVWLDDPAKASLVVSGRSGDAAAPVFVFSGQGSQWWGMGRGLLETEPVFRDTVHSIDEILREFSDWSLLDELARGEEESRIHETEVAQPALFAIQVGLVRVWESWGIAPAAVVGHSIGEVAAAVAAGILTLREATEVVYHRSRLQGRTAGLGRMAVVGIPLNEIRERLESSDGAVEVAGINSPSLVTLAGDTAGIEKLVEELSGEGRFVRWLPIDYAFHTHQMEPICDELLAALRHLQPKDSGVAFFSTVEGSVLPGSKLDAEYWWRNVRRPVQFGPAIESLIDDGSRAFLEIGPHHALQSSIRECLASRGVAGNVVHSLKRESDDALELAKNLAGLHLAGVAIDWKAYLGDAALVRLPPYPWQRRSYWMESPITKRLRTGAEVHPLLGMPVDGPAPRWEVLLDPKSFPYLDDHQFWNRVIFPAAGFVEMGVAAGKIVHPNSHFTIEDFELKRILFLSAGDLPTLRVEYEDEESRFRVYGRGIDSDTWHLHATGRIVVQHPTPMAPVKLGEIRKRLPHHCPHWDFYGYFHALGYEYGPAFRQIEQLWFGDNETLVEIVVRADGIGTGYHIHPALLDACFQSLSAGAFDFSGVLEKRGHFLPNSLGSLELVAPLPEDRFWVHVEFTTKTGDRIVADIGIFDVVGNPVGRLRDFEISWVQGRAGSDSIEDSLYDLQWVEAPLPESEPLSLSRILLFADSRGVAESLREELGDRCHSVFRIEAGASWQEVDETHFVIDPAQPAHLHRVLERFFSEGSEKTAIVHLWGLDHPADLDSSVLSAAQTTGVLTCLAIGRFLHKREIATRFCAVLKGSAAGAESGVARLASAPIIGFLRVAGNELPRTHWSAILIDEQSGIVALANEVTGGDPESEIAYVGGSRHVRRLRRTQVGEYPRRLRRVCLSDGGIRPFRLEVERSGTLEGLVCNETHRRRLRPNEVEVRTSAAAVNFRDLLKVLGVYPGDAEELRNLGDDFAGIVADVGDAISDLRPGDEVVGVSRGCFRSHFVTRRETMFRRPAGISLADAAALPIVFLTAHHALVDLARLRPGESILIHAAAGGVGLAAIQVARRLGLVIFATAGSDEKRRLLREMGVGHVMDSRSLAFAEEILRITDGRGVDAVLNSLSGEFIPKSLSVLAPFGRFLEIGKVDVFSGRKIELHALRNNAAYFVIDMEQLLMSRRATGLMEELREAFEAGIYCPLPTRVFPADRAPDVFREMSQGKHIGKLILDFSGEGIMAGRPTENGHLFPGDVAYLISGGANGFGFETAKWLAQNGARYLALLSRTGPGSTRIVNEIEELRERGVNVADIRVDITDAKAVVEAVRTVEVELAPVGGVIHAAMVLNDLPIAELDRESMLGVLDPKILGGWNLHAATLHRTLEFFVCYSSVSGVIGSMHQANYVAGNVFLDELARYRRSIGLAGLSVNWGGLTGAGFVDRSPKTLDYLKSVGIPPVDVNEALRVLGKFIARDVSHVAAARIDWATLMRFFPSIATLRFYEPIISTLAQDRRSGVMRSIILAAPHEQRRLLVEDFLAGQVAAVFGADAASLDRSVAVTSLGLDSLMAIELLNRIETELGIVFPMGSIVNGPSIQQLAAPVLDALHASEILDDSSGDEREDTDVLISGDASPVPFGSSLESR